MRQEKFNNEPSIVKRAFKEAGLEIVLGILGLLFLCFNLIFSFYFIDKSLPSIVNFCIIFHPAIIYLRQYLRSKIHDEPPLLNIYFKALFGEFDEDDIRGKCLFYASLANVITATIFQLVIMIT